MHSNCKDYCNNCQILKKKIDIYEKCFRDLKELEINEEIDLGESLYLVKDNDGNTIKKLKSDLSESFLVVENGKNLKEISNKERQSIQSQDALHDLENKKEYVKKINGVTSVGYYILSLGKWILFF